MLTLVLCSQMPQQEAGSPTLRILMDPAERAHLESTLQQRAEAARTQGPPPRGLDRPPRPSRPLPRCPPAAAAAAVPGAVDEVSDAKALTVSLTMENGSLHRLIASTQQQTGSCCNFGHRPSGHYVELSTWAFLLDPWDLHPQQPPPHSMPRTHPSS